MKKLTSFLLLVFSFTFFSYVDIITIKEINKKFLKSRSHKPSIVFTFFPVFSSSLCPYAVILTGYSFEVHFFNAT